MYLTQIFYAGADYGRYNSSVNHTVKISQFSKEGKKIAPFNSIAEVCRKFGVTDSQMFYALRKNKLLKGYYFIRDEDNKE